MSEITQESRGRGNDRKGRIEKTFEPLKGYLNELSDFPSSLQFATGDQQVGKATIGIDEFIRMLEAYVSQFNLSYMDNEKQFLSLPPEDTPRE